MKKNEIIQNKKMYIFITGKTVDENSTTSETL